MTRLRVKVVQLGARRHYAVPRILHAAGMLDALYVDTCAVKGLPRLLARIPVQRRPGPLRRLLDRVPEGIPATRIHAFDGFGLRFFVRQRFERTPADEARTFLWAGRRLCELAIGSFRERPGAGADAYYGYHGTALELMQYASERGRLGIVDQCIAPYRIARRLIIEESERHPDWSAVAESGVAGEAYADREEEEWRTAGLVLCGSEFVRDGVVERGGAAERCVVVPYGTDPGFVAARRPRPHGGPLRVLTVGEVGLRKGAPYVLEAAERLGRRASFRMVGAVEVGPGIERRLREHVELTGAVSRSRMREHYSWADVLVLPSLCEGSAGATYEALAAGLPVVTTRNTGSVVRDGEDGFIVPIRDAAAIVDRLEQLAADPELHRALAERAEARLADVTFPGYAERLIAALTRAPAP
jgi:glycosyltransferase involved in cell wall biosynthesis